MQASVAPLPPHDAPRKRFPLVLACRQHEFEADAGACRLMAAAGVPPERWGDGLALLLLVAAQETGPAEGGRSRGMLAVEYSEAVASCEAEGEAEAESASYTAAAQELAAGAWRHLAGGRVEAAQKLLDGSLRWPLPAVAEPAGAAASGGNADAPSAGGAHRARAVLGGSSNRTRRSSGDMRHVNSPAAACAGSRSPRLVTHACGGATPPAERRQSLKDVGAAPDRAHALCDGSVCDV